MELFNYFNRKNIIEIKSVPKGVAVSDTKDRGTMTKLQLPLFLFKPPFGWPRIQDLATIRRLARTPQYAQASKAIIDIMVTVPWDIVPKEGFEEDNETTKAHIDEVKEFFHNPNTTKETFDDFQRKLIRDTLEINSGIIVKEFNHFEQMVEMRIADGATFLMNPNKFGKFTEREEIIPIKDIAINSKPISPNSDLAKQGFGGLQFTPFGNEEQIGQGLTVGQASNQAAYFQFPWGVSGGTGGRPVPFGIREIVWIQDNPTSFNVYGLSNVEYLLDLLQTLVYDIQYFRDYYEDNNIPKGFINLPGATEETVTDFANHWNEFQMTVNNTGQVKRASHRVPITNMEGSVQFERIQFTAQELDFIAQTKLFSNMVWGMLGVNPSELGFTDGTNRASELSQDRKFMRRAILPRLKKLAEKYNQEIISEFEFDDVEFKYIMRDIDDDASKAKLFKTQLDAGYKTINEIRKEEGLPPLDGGDEIKQTSSNDENPMSDIDEANERLEQAKEDMESKALTTESAATLREFEIFGDLPKVLRDKKKELLRLIRQELSQRDGLQTKALTDVLAVISGLFTTDNLKRNVDVIIQGFFRKGNERAEKQLDMNIPENTRQIQFISNMTFDNIKDLEEEMKNDLRAVLQRAIVKGQGIGKIADEIDKVFSVGEVRAKAIARTETSTAENQGELQAFKDSGIEMRKFILITNDDRTSQVSKAMDRKYGEKSQSILLDELFSVVVNGKTFEGQAPPFMPNDRDSVLYLTQNEFLEAKS